MRNRATTDLLDQGNAVPRLFKKPPSQPNATLLFAQQMVAFFLQLLPIV